jgi:hypothetical protein
MSNRTLLLVLILCALAPVAQAQSGLFVTTSDFVTGSAAFLAPGASAAQVNLLNIHSDAEARYHQGRVYVINRLGQDNILVLDEGDLRTPLLQFSTGNRTNPHDMEIVAPDKAYVSRYDSPGLLMVNPQDGTHLGTIDLSGFADGDGLPEMSQMEVVGSRLYVACQVQDRNAGFVPAEQGLLVVIDLDTDRVVDMDPTAPGVQALPLSAGNPGSLFAAGNQLILAETSAFGDTKGGIEVIDLSTGSGRLVLTEAELGGDLTSLELVSPTRGYAVVADLSFANRVVPVDLSTGQVGPALEGHSTGFTPSLAADGSRLYVADRGTFADPDAAGVLIYDTATHALLAGPISTGLPPSHLVVLGKVPLPTAVEEDSPARPLQPGLGLAYPNPFNRAVLIPFALQQGDALVELAVYDLLGRRVRTLFAGLLPEGAHLVSWDGRDDAGQSAASGVYWVSVRQGGWGESRKLTLLR